MKATVKEAARERDFGTVVSKGAVRAMAVGMAVFVVGKFLPKTIGNMHSDIALTTAGLALAGVALTGSVVDDVVEDLKLSWTFVQNRKNTVKTRQGTSTKPFEKSTMKCATMCCTIPRPEAKKTPLFA